MMASLYSVGTTRRNTSRCQAGL